MINDLGVRVGCEKNKGGTVVCAPTKDMAASAHLGVTRSQQH
jgi:hypothetical protein